MKNEKPGGRDVTTDFLLCNRCGSCKAVCPVFGLVREEWASARGKIEVAEAFFRGGEVDPAAIRGIFDLCLHCKTCEENCPSGARADEIIMAVRAEMGRRGMIQRIKRVALYALDHLDAFLFNAMRMAGLSRKGPVHAARGRSPLSFLYPLLGWSRQRFLPLPDSKAFIDANQEEFYAARFDGALSDPRKVSAIGCTGADSYKAAALIEIIAETRSRNITENRRASLFLGHAVNNFFSDEAAEIVFLLNLLGVDVIVPSDQICCFAPNFYTGDIEGARDGAARLVRILSARDCDWIVTSCASGGLMLKKEYPRLLGLEEDGFFRIGWDEEAEVFIREGAGDEYEKYETERDLYEKKIAGKVRDINELLAGFLGFQPSEADYERLFSKDDGDISAKAGVDRSISAGGKDTRPVVVYHHPCHLNRGQGISEQPEYILRLLPGYRFVKMEDDDLCCGGGGMFTFTEAESSEKIGRKKIEAIAEARPDIVATSCPVCRIQLLDLLGRDYGNGLAVSDEELAGIPVMTPAELLAADIKRIIGK